MATTSFWLSSTSPLPPERDEQGTRRDVYMPTSDVERHTRTLMSRPVLMGVIISALGFTAMLLLMGCVHSPALQQSRSVRATHLAPLDIGPIAFVSETP